MEFEDVGWYATTELTNVGQHTELKLTECRIAYSHGKDPMSSYCQCRACMNWNPTKLGAQKKYFFNFCRFENQSSKRKTWHIAMLCRFQDFGCAKVTHSCRQVALKLRDCLSTSCVQTYRWIRIMWLRHWHGHCLCILFLSLSVSVSWFLIYTHVHVQNAIEQCKYRFANWSDNV